MDKEAEAIETIGSIDTIDTAVDGPSFGGYLNTLLTERNLTPRDLASLLELDLSLVYKWLRGERTPRFNSGHADSIAEALHLPPTERQTLFQSQVRSLRERPAHRSRPAPRSRFVSAPVDALIDHRMIVSHWTRSDAARCERLHDDASGWSGARSSRSPGGRHRDTGDRAISALAGSDHSTDLAGRGRA